MPSAQIASRRVVIAGGGIAALEALMALHDLGEGRFEITLVAPADDFVLRPMSVAVPFSAGHVTRVALADVCRRFGARFVRAALVSVDPEERSATCSDGEVLDYDALVLATGAAVRAAYRHALTFTDEDPVRLNGLLRDIEQGYCGSVAVVVPPSGSWSLPAYELALLIARHAGDAGVETPVHVVTPEPAPLAIFGPRVTDVVQELLDAAEISVHAGAYASVARGGRITMSPGDRRLDVARVVALPVVDGRPIPGIPADDHGFVATDDHGRVIALDGVYAVGDGANFPVKQGGLAAQQADAAAQHIAAAAGAPLTAEPFRPVLRGMLLTGGRPRFLRNDPRAGAGDGQVSDERLWWPATKVFGHYLAPWLARESMLPGGPGGPAGLAVEAVLPAGRGARPLSLEPLGT